LKKENASTIFGGRLAEYKYYDMHQIIAAALTAVKREFKENED
jgi:UDP-galactopyranose mutase